MPLFSNNTGQPRPYFIIEVCLNLIEMKNGPQDHNSLFAL